MQGQFLSLQLFHDMNGTESETISNWVWIVGSTHEYRGSCGYIHIYAKNAWVLLWHISEGAIVYLLWFSKMSGSLGHTLELDFLQQLMQSFVEKVLLCPLHSGGRDEKEKHAKIRPFKILPIILCVCVYSISKSSISELKLNFCYFVVAIVFWVVFSVAVQLLGCTELLLSGCLLAYFKRLQLQI